MSAVSARDAREAAAQTFDVLVVCHDAQADSVVDALLFAVESARCGKKMGMIFTGAALLAAAQGHFLWSRGFWPQQVRWKLADHAMEAGLPVLGRGQARVLDVSGLIRYAHDLGVRFFAGPSWITLLGLEGSLPAYLQQVGFPTVLAMMEQAKIVIGSL